MEASSSYEIHEATWKQLSGNESCSQIRIKDEEFQNEIDLQDYMTVKIIKSDVDEVVKLEATSGQQIKTEPEPGDYELKLSSINYNASGNTEVDSKIETKSELSFVKQEVIDEVRSARSSVSKTHASSKKVICLEFIESDESPGKNGKNIKLSCSACNSTKIKGLLRCQLKPHINKVHKNERIKCNYCSAYVSNKQKAIGKHFKRCSILFITSCGKQIPKREKIWSICELCNIRTSRLDKHNRKVHGSTRTSNPSTTKIPASHQTDSIIVKHEGKSNSHTLDISNDEDNCKLFVGGLPNEAKEGDISTYFQSFGDLDSINLKIDSNTGRSRGFAFVSFKSVNGLKNAFAQKTHTIKGKRVDVKRATAKEGKIFVCGLSPELTNEDVESHFSQFGEIVQVEMPIDKDKIKRKSYCFIKFRNEKSAKQLLDVGTTTLHGGKLYIKNVTQKPDFRSSYMTGIGYRGPPCGFGGGSVYGYGIQLNFFGDFRGYARY